MKIEHVVTVIIILAITICNLFFFSPHIKQPMTPSVIKDASVKINPKTASPAERDIKEKKQKIALKQVSAASYPIYTRFFNSYDFPLIKVRELAIE